MGTFKVNLDGSIEVGTADDALALSRAIQRGGSPQASIKAAATKANGALTSVEAKQIAEGLSDWVLPNAVSFLSAIANAAPNSPTADEMMSAMGIDSPKALGGRSAAINKLLEKAGFEPDSVYESTRTRTGRTWRARGRLSEALTRVKNIRNAQLL